MPGGGGEVPGSGPTASVTASDTAPINRLKAPPEPDDPRTLEDPRPLRGRWSLTGQSSSSWAIEPRMRVSAWMLSIR